MNAIRLDVYCWFPIANLLASQQLPRRNWHPCLRRKIDLYPRVVLERGLKELGDGGLLD